MKIIRPAPSGKIGFYGCDIRIQSTAEVLAAKKSRVAITQSEWKARTRENANKHKENPPLIFKIIDSSIVRFL
jgi:hypothetical protein